MGTEECYVSNGKFLRPLFASEYLYAISVIRNSDSVIDSFYLASKTSSVRYRDAFIIGAPVTTITRSEFWKDFAIRIALPALIYGWVGWWLADKLCAVSNLQIYKAWFVIGIAFEIVGVLSLSHIVAKSESLQNFLTGPLVDQIYGFLLCSDLGMGIRVHFLGLGSPTAIEGGIGSDLVIPLLLVVVLPFVNFVPIFVQEQGISSWTPEVRANRLGLVLLLLGLAMQFVAAIHDMSR